MKVFNIQPAIYTSVALHEPNQSQPLERSKRCLVDYSKILLSHL